MNRSKIPYTDYDFNAIIGCKPYSEACEHCWAARMVARIQATGHPDFQGLVKDGHWTGAVSNRLPILCKRFRAPAGSTVFSLCMSDFAYDFPDAWRDKLFGFQLQHPEWTWLNLTKRAQEAGAYFGRVAETCEEEGVPNPIESADNIWAGVTIESGKYMDRLGHITGVHCPKNAFISYEPLIAPVSDRLVLPPSSRLKCVIIGAEKLAGGKAGRWAGVDPVGWWNEVYAIQRYCQVNNLTCFTKQGPAANGRISENPADWPEPCRVQTLPWSVRKKAGAK